MLSLRRRPYRLVMLKLLRPPVMYHRRARVCVLPSRALYTVPPVDCILAGKAIRISWPLLFLPVSAVLLVFNISAAVVCINRSRLYLFYKTL